jgi:hypothetical protein
MQSDLERFGRTAPPGTRRSQRISGDAVLGTACALVCLLSGACGQDRTWLAARDAATPAVQDAIAEPEPEPGPAPLAAPFAPPGAALLADWPSISIGVESRQFSSFDREGGNDDGFSGRYSALYTEAAEYVIFDALGPGRLNTLWFTSGAGGTRPLNQGQIRFYFDDELTPRADLDSDRLFSGSEPGFPSDLVFDNSRSTGGFVSFVPMPFAGRLRITTSSKPYFYNAQYDTFPVDVPLRSWSTEGSGALLEPLFAESLGDAASEEPDREQVIPLEYSYTGAGTLESLRVRLAPESIGDLHAARIQISWDEQAAPAVDCPLDMFFGSGLGLTPVRALGFSMRMDPPELVSHFPMPFWRGFRLSITGVQAELSVRIGPEHYRARESGYFHAAFAGENPPAGDQDFQYLQQRSAGKLVGTVLTVVPANPAKDKGWWEGDLRSYANGRRSPSIHGTGHEDDHLGGWSNGFFARPFTLPMNGEPASEILDFNGQYNGNVSMYRLWTGIPFLRELQHSVEHGRANDRGADYQSTSFFYATSSDWLSDSDRLVVCDPASRDAHGFVASGEGAPVEVRGSFEGRAYRAGFDACHQNHSGAAEFRLRVAPDNRGVYLRRLYDQSSARQRAEISVDGERLGDWYTVEGNSTSSWSERDYFLPRRFTGDKTELAIRVLPVGDSPPWDAAEYRSLSVTPP